MTRVLEHTNGLGLAVRAMPHHNQAVVPTSHKKKNWQVWQLLDKCRREQAGRPIGDPSLPHLIVAPAPHLVATGQRQCVVVACAHLQTRTAACADV